MNLAPIALWRQDEQTRVGWHAFINSAASRVAITAALAEMQSEVCNLPEGAYLMRGSNMLVEKLLNMGGDKTTKPRLSFQLPNPE